MIQRSISVKLSREAYEGLNQIASEEGTTIQGTCTGILNALGERRYYMMAARIFPPSGPESLDPETEIDRWAGNAPEKP